ncbi:hypothetical protein [Kitasatospora sp. NPDC092286]|uniref:hypothetical protein n=1 Tax=Kitasatospora sp. NPDC092286 TaxID=3364087 RepID=UPI0038050440
MNQPLSVRLLLIACAVLSGLLISVVTAVLARADGRSLPGSGLAAGTAFVGWMAMCAALLAVYG